MRIETSGRGTPATLIRPHLASHDRWFVLVHGSRGQRSDLAQLGVALARRGASSCAVDWGGITSGTTLAAASDVIADRAETLDRTSGHGLVMVAWTDGCLPGMAACAALGSRSVVRFVGLSGTYGWGGDEAIDGLDDVTLAWLQGRSDDLTSQLNAQNTTGPREGFTRYDLVAGQLDPDQRRTVNAAAEICDHGGRAASHLIPDATRYDLVIPRTPGGRAVVDLLVGPPP